MGNDLIDDLSSVHNRRYVEAGNAQEEGHVRHDICLPSTEDSKSIAVLGTTREVCIAWYLANHGGHVQGTQCRQDANEDQDEACRYDAASLKRRWQIQHRWPCETVDCNG